LSIPETIISPYHCCRPDSDGCGRWWILYQRSHQVALQGHQLSAEKRAQCGPHGRWHTETLR
jgi:hypothetical protein